MLDVLSRASSSSISRPCLFSYIERFSWQTEIYELYVTKTITKPLELVT